MSSTRGTAASSEAELAAGEHFVRLDYQEWADEASLHLVKELPRASLYLPLLLR